MVVPDVNVLVYAHRVDVPEHSVYSAWLSTLVEGQTPFALSDEVLASFVRVVTNPRIFRPPTPLAVALKFCEALLARPNAHVLQPGPRRWGIFVRLAAETGATGKLVPDAWLAALVIEAGGELATADRDFRRFRGLRWHRPA